MATVLSEIIDAEDYYDNPRMSNSKLSVLAESPELFDALYVSKTMKQEVTPEMRFGSLLHTFVLEPSFLGSRFVVAPECDRRTKEGKAIWADFQETLIGRTIVDEDDMKRCSGIVDAMVRNPGVQRLVNLPSHVEYELFFERCYVPCKAKLDLLSMDCGVIVDLKTSNDPSPTGFQKSVVNYGYHRQAAMYIDAVQDSLGIDCRMVFIVVNKKAPFVAAIYELSSDLLNAGRMELDGLLEEYKRRSATGNWVSDWADGSVHEIDKPKWY